MTTRTWLLLLLWLHLALMASTAVGTRERRLIDPNNQLDLSSANKKVSWKLENKNGCKLSFIMTTRASLLWLFLALMTSTSLSNRERQLINLKQLDLSSANINVSWILENKNGSIVIPGSVPGGVYSDLHNAGVIGDVLEGFNDVLTRWVAYDSWTYTAQFNVAPKDLAYEVANIVFEGVDTVAYIDINDTPIGSTDNMFVRYVFDVKPHLKVGTNELKIQFASPVEAAKKRSEKHFTQPECVPDVYNGECHANQLRKMQASFSWDWGPAFPSVGLWKKAYIEFYKNAIIRSVTTHTKKLDNQWSVTVKAHIESGTGAKHIKGFLSASLAVEGNQSIKIGKDLEVDTRDDGTAEAELIFIISENVVRLWWPNGYGEQPLYKLDVYLSTKGTVQVSHKQVQIGFRTVEVVEEDASLKTNQSSAGDGLTFYFKVNGYPIFMKGSNWIPAHILPEFGDDRKLVNNLLYSAKDAHMNMLRVWGGGVYESDYFYSKCDELGILIWQDFMFACAMYPADVEFLNTVKPEIEQNVIRLQHHPCIALWAGNNENEAALRGNWYKTQPDFDKYKEEYIKLYVDTIKPIVEGLDPDRRYMESSPSNGQHSVQEGYIATNPYDPHYGDTHYYNYLADNWDQNIYPNTRFASEYGFQALPTIVTMKTATKDPKDFSVDSEYSKHRQHSPNGYQYIETQMLRHFDLDKNDSKYFEKFVFYSQISQSMAIKAETEFYRQNQANWYTMGALYWQLNDVWQAPSWSGIEWTGNWKMLHYFAMDFFAPILVSPRLLMTGAVEVYLINDRFIPIHDAYIILEVFNWTSMDSIKREVFSAHADPLSSTKQDINFDLWFHYNKDEVFLKFTLMGDGYNNTPVNYVFPTPFKSIKGYKAPNIQFSISKGQLRPDQSYDYIIHISTDSIVLFLWFETTYKEGYFDSDGVVITEPHSQMLYVNKKDIDAEDLKKSITYQYYTP